MYKVVIILPTYNESEIIDLTINEVLNVVAEIKNFNCEILVVDSASPDGTGKIVKNIEKNNYKVHLLSIQERGLGLGLVKGYEYGFNVLNADIVLQMDADLQHNPRDIPKILEPFLRGVDFVQGSRFIKGGGNNLEPHRRFLSWAANLSARILFGALKIHEFTTSFRAFTREVYKKINFEKIPYHGKSFIFQPAFLYAAILHSIKITEVPIIFTDRRKGYSKMDMLKYSSELLMYGIKCRMKKNAKFIKFCVVGSSGLIIQTIIFALLKALLHPSIATAFGAEAAIINGFIWNNRWTYKEDEIKRSRKMVGKFLQYNFICLGSIAIQMFTLFSGPEIFGKSTLIVWFFYGLGVGLGLISNYYFYGKVIWKKS